jgi:hypothetical protein
MKGRGRHGGAFFLKQSSIINGFVQGAGQHFQLAADERYALSRIKHPLSLGQPLVSQPGTFPLGGGDKERRRSTLTQLLHRTLHGSQRHSEGLDDLSLAGCAVDDELAGKQSKTTQIIRRMAEDRHLAVEIVDGLITTLEGQIGGDESRSVTKERKLDLRHATILTRPAQDASPAHEAKRVPRSSKSSEWRSGVLSLL